MAFNDKARATIAAKKAAALEAAAKQAPTPVDPRLAQLVQDDAARLQATPIETGYVAKGQSEAPEPSPAAPPRNLFSGTTKKLEVFGKPGTSPLDPLPGFQLFWFDDIKDGLIISQAKASGWVFVEKDELAINDDNTSPGNNALDNHVRRWVGLGPNNVAISSYLMKKPNWLYDLHMYGPESTEVRVHQQIDAQLLSGSFNANPNDRRYTSTNPYPGTRSGLPPIQMGRNYVKPTST